MGIQKVFNDRTNKWELRGWGFVWSYDTEEEADANKVKAYQEHMANIKAFNFVSNMLLAYRK